MGVKQGSPTYDRGHTGARENFKIFLTTS